MLRFISAIVLVCKAVCLATFAGFCALTMMQVINRYAFGLQMFWTEEVVLLLFIWSVMIGVPIALWHREEIVVDIISFKPGMAERTRLMVVDLCSVGFLLTLAWSGWQLVDRGGQSLSPALGLPRSIFFWSIPIGAGLGALALIGRRLGGGQRVTDPLDFSDADHAHD